MTNFKKIKILGRSVDNALVSHILKHGGIIATIDMKLKEKIKQHGGSVISLSNNRIVLEPSKT